MLKTSVRKRLLALATQKFVADIATDAFQYSKVRQSGNRKSGKVIYSIQLKISLKNQLTSITGS